MLVMVLQLMTAPQFPEGTQMLQTIFGVVATIEVIFFTVFWEFVENFADLTAFNDLMEEKIKEQTMALMDWLSLKVYGEKIGS